MMITDLVILEIYKAVKEEEGLLFVKNQVRHLSQTIMVFQNSSKLLKKPTELF